MATPRKPPGEKRIETIRLLELVSQAEVDPGEVMVASLKSIRELQRKKKPTEDDSRRNSMACKALSVVSAIYRQFPELTEKRIKMPGADFISTPQAREKDSLPKSMQQDGDYKRAPRPADVE